MTHAFFTPRIRAATLALTAGLIASAAACKGTERGVTISGDVAGLDTLATRGDSLIAQAGRPPLAIDSLRAAAEGKITRSRTRSPAATAATKGNTTSTRLPTLPGDNPMSQRAQARGDSMARAAAMRLVAGTSADGKTRGDTMRGVVTLIGSEPARQVVLRTSEGATISMSGMVTSGLARLVGSEITIRGVSVSSRDVVVSDYVVRSTDGQPAYDGRLDNDAEGWSLQLTDGSGRKHLAAVPPALQAMQGTRVWVSTKRGTTTFGAIGRRY